MEKIADYCPAILDGLTNIKTPKGVGKYSGIKISELGYVMIKVAFPDGTFTNYNAGKITEILPGSELQFCE